MAIERFRGDYYFLSNMYPLDPGVFDTDGIRVPTVEHAYQAQKFGEKWMREEVRKGRDGVHSKRIASGLIKQGVEVVSEWDEIKVPVMTELVDQKFRIHHELGSLLVATYNEELIEGNPWKDRFWGHSPVGSGIGENHLGKILMELREKMVQEDQAGLKPPVNSNPPQ